MNTETEQELRHQILLLQQENILLKADGAAAEKVYSRLGLRHREARQKIHLLEMEVAILQGGNLA